MFMYRYEAKGIQAWILATDKLREMVGASALVERLGGDARARVRQVGGDDGMVTDAAGGATILFADKATLQAFLDGWHLFLDETLPGLQVVDAWAPVDARDPAAARRLLQARLEAARNRASPEFPAAGPLSVRCGRTGLPAVERAGDTPRESAVALDRATRVKQRAFSEADRLHARILAAAREVDASLEPFRPTNDMAAFGEGYRAVIHADADGIGRYLTSANLSGERFRAFSRALADVTRMATGEAVAGLARAHGQGFAGAPDVGFRPIVLGGDDLTVITHARYGLAFAERFLQAFSRRAGERLAAFDARAWTASAGVAFVKEGFPFHAGYRLAESLCSAAKRAGGGSLLFHRVSTATTGDWDEVLREELTARPSADGRVRTLAPPAWKVAGDGGPTLRDLAALAVELRGLPRGAVRTWLREALLGAERADALWQRTREVAEARPRTDPGPLPVVRRLEALGADPRTAFVASPAGGWSPLHAALTWSSLCAGQTMLLWEAHG